MTAFQQNFSTYPGDTIAPLFTVLDANGAPINISTMSEIRWDARSKLALAPAITKLLSAGGVSLVNSGITGQLQVNLSGTDTAALSGLYLHEVILTDAFASSTTVTFGQMTVGRAPVWTYDATQLGSAPGSGSPLMQIRRLIGDVKYNDQQMYDEEINFAFGQRGSIYGAAADCARNLAAEMSRQIDLVQGDLKQNYSNRAKAYTALSKMYDNLASARGAGLPYAGGVSLSDKSINMQNADRVPPAFAIGMTDDLWWGGIQNANADIDLWAPLPDF